MIPYLPPIKPRVLKIQREFRGTNKRDPFYLQDIFATDSKNTSSTLFPTLSVRPGYQTLGTSSYGMILGMGVWKEQELHAVFADGTWRRWSGSAWVTLKSGLHPSAKWSFTNFKGNLAEISLVGTNGVDPMMYYDGYTVQNVWTAPSGANFVDQYADRIWCAVGNTLYCSAYRIADDWTTVNQDMADPFYTEVETPDGEVIEGIVSNSTSLIVTKASSIHKLFGVSAEDFTLRRVTREVGFINNNSAVIIKGVMYLLDERGIYEYSGSTLPDDTFSLPVQDYVLKINTAARKHCCVGTDGHNLYVAIPILSTTAPDTILVYDFQAQSWDVWKDIHATSIVKIGSQLYIGDRFGRVLKLGGTTDNGAPILWERVSIPYSAPSLSQKIRWPRMWFTVDLAVGSMLKIHLSKSDSGDTDWVLVKTITASNQLEGIRIIIPTNIITNASWIRYKLEGAGPCKVKEFTYEMLQKPLR